ncbi:hypothetical protein JNL27_13635 [bacterium]|nr:hypothetical protein [bacterium]
MLPVKEYAFLFENSRKQILVDTELMYLDRHLLLGELFIEYIIAFVASNLIAMMFSLENSKKKNK